MQFSSSTVHAIDSLLYMVRNGGENRYDVELLAGAQNISPSYLAKVLQRLSRKGIVTSQRGPHGGYSLARPPEKVNLRQIAEIFEGSVPLYDCLASVKGCQIAIRCLIIRAFREAEEEMFRALEKVTLADIVGHLPEHHEEKAPWLEPATAG